MQHYEVVFLYLALPVILFLGWSYTAVVVRSSLPTLQNKAIVLLIAHPDDEAMFFAPTVLGLTKPELGNHLKILCLSNGNADGLGAVRQKELLASAARLGVRSASDVLVIDEPGTFPDSMQVEWPAERISALLDELFVKRASSSGGGARRRDVKAAPGADGRPPETSIDALLTFDAGGVSGHANHRALHHGAVAWARSLTRGSAGAGWAAPVLLYSLTSVNVARKYAGALDAPFTLAWNAGGNFMRRAAAASRDRPDRLMFLNDVPMWVRAMGTMVHAHKSQMVWFRWGWISLGRYMVVNDLRRVPT